MKRTPPRGHGASNLPQDEDEVAFTRRIEGNLDAVFSANVDNQRDQIETDTKTHDDSEEVFPRLKILPSEEEKTMKIDDDFQSQFDIRRCRVDNKPGMPPNTSNVETRRANDDEIPLERGDLLHISCTSLLLQFSNVKVRADLINGRFGRHINPDILPLLDEIKCMLMPRWQSGGFSGNKVRSSQAAVHFKKLMSRDPGIFQTSSNGSLTYSEWMDTLESIANDRYWNQTPVSERCTHIIDQVHVSSQQAVDTSDCKPSTTLETKPRKITKSKIEEIVLSGSSTESISDSSESRLTSSSDNSSESVSKRQRRNRRKRSDRRSVVTPPVYQTDGKQSLEDYLYTFEQYFKNKYQGNAYDQTQMLSKFLSGELLKVYEIRGGRRLKYSKMKAELLQYYKQQKIGSKTYWRKKLTSATKQDDETYDLFGMRMIEMASLAYPKDKKESAAQLRHNFLKNIPPNIAGKIQDAERASNALSSSSKHLPFSSIMKIANEVEKSAVKPKTVMWTSTNAHQSPPQHYTRPRNFSSKNAYKPVANEVVKKCSYCDRVGHEKAECWRAAKLCLICGGDHFIEKCPKYDPRRRSMSQRRYESRPLNDQVSLERGNQ